MDKVKFDQGVVLCELAASLGKRVDDEDRRVGSQTRFYLLDLQCNSGFVPAAQRLDRLLYLDGIRRNDADEYEMRQLLREGSRLMLQATR